MPRFYVRGGATAIEVGIPFSDPLADGPTVQRAGQRALAGGMTTVGALELLSRLRSAVPVPLVPMTYASPVMAYGEGRLGEAVAAGYLILVEGESDCWTLWHAGFPALGLPGAKTANSSPRSRSVGGWPVVTRLIMPRAAARP